MSLFFFLFFGCAGSSLQGRGFSSGNVWTSLWLRLSQHTGSECRLSSCSTWAHLLCGIRNPPRPGIEPASSALAGKLPSTALPGKSHIPSFKHLLHSYLEKEVGLVIVFSSIYQMKFQRSSDIFYLGIIVVLVLPEDCSDFG